MPIPVDAFLLDPTDSGTLQARIRRMVAEGILAGRFRRGERLPSTRALARHLGVSRITVTLAFTELLADDYLIARGRSGYYVSEGAPEPPPFPARRPTDRVDWSRALRPGLAGLPGIEKPADWRRYRYPFIYGQADETLFDHANWRLCALRALGQKDFEALTADQFAADDPLLVEFVTRQLLPRRGIAASADQVLVTLGAQNALWLAAQVLLGPGRRAAIEDPSWPPLRAILAQVGCATASVPVDAAGLPPAAVPEGTDVVFVTPSHHCPTTATLPIERRQALLARAAAEDMLVVEDDYEFEMSFRQTARPALKALDREGRVIHVGSFSKSLFPGLRLGYLVGAAPFIAEARALRALVLRHPPGHVQRTAAYFLSLGHFDALARRTQRAYGERRWMMEAAIARHGLEMAGPPGGGSAFWMRAAGVDAEALALRLRADGVLIEPGAPFFLRPGAGREFYRIAYSSIPAARIDDGVRLIAEAIRR